MYTDQSIFYYAYCIFSIQNTPKFSPQNEEHPIYVDEYLEPNVLVSVCGESVQLSERVRTGPLLDNVLFLHSFERALKTTMLRQTQELLNLLLSGTFGSSHEIFYSRAIICSGNTPDTIPQKERGTRILP